MTGRHPIEVVASNKRTFCEVLREIWDILDALGEPTEQRIKTKLIEVYDMGKRMDAKLREYKAGWDAEEWQPNEDKAADEAQRSQRGRP